MLRDAEMVVVPADEDGGVGYRPHAEGLPLPPLLHLIGGACSPLREVPVGDSDDGAPNVEGEGKLVARNNEGDALGVGAAGVCIGEHLGDLYVGIVGGVGV
jgi:hypothetical protein